MNYEIKYVSGHIEVFDSKGNFLFSADTIQEASMEISLWMAA